MKSRDLFRWYALVIVVTAGLSVGAASLGAHLIYNATDSLPRGWYWLTPGQTIRRHFLVAFPIPPNVHTLVHERRYLPDDALLVKPVVAVQGDDICTDRGVFTVNGNVIGDILERDFAGRELPHADACRSVREGEVFVASTNPRSFDSRTFGSIPVSAIRGAVRSLWTY
ncbi:MAG TPA: S26 family signal peptidase [Polyangiaceae bacterium]